MVLSHLDVMTRSIISFNPTLFLIVNLLSSTRESKVAINDRREAASGLGSSFDSMSFKCDKISLTTWENTEKYKGGRKN